MPLSVHMCKVVQVARERLRSACSRTAGAPWLHPLPKAGTVVHHNKAVEVPPGLCRQHQAHIIAAVDVQHASEKTNESLKGRQSLKHRSLQTQGSSSLMSDVRCQMLLSVKGCCTKACFTSPTCSSSSCHQCRRPSVTALPRVVLGVKCTPP